MTLSLMQFADEGYFSPQKIAALLMTTKEDIANSAGLGRDAVVRQERVKTNKTQRKLREMVEIINKVTPHFGSALMVYA